MADVKPRVRVPSTASAGEAIVIKTLISHPMESGQRKDSSGNTIPRQIINRFTCEFNGEMVIDVTLEPAISTNPYFEFEAVVPERATSPSPGTTTTARLQTTEDRHGRLRRRPRAREEAHDEKR
jgi:sulfur-oxidizing protein SoxZ